MQHVVVVREKVRKIRRAKPLFGRTVRLTWDDGGVDEKDIAPILANQRSLVRLRTDDALFSLLTVSSDGDRIMWEDGAAISAAALMKLPQTSMSSDEFRAMMADLHLTAEGLAVTLGLSRRSITDYRGGVPIPKSVVLAMRYIQAIDRL